VPNLRRENWRPSDDSEGQRGTEQAAGGSSEPDPGRANPDRENQFSSQVSGRSNQAAGQAKHYIQSENLKGDSTMSEESASIQQLIQLMQEIHGAVQILTANQEKIAAEQQHAAKAIGEAGAILKNHAQVLRYTQEAVIKLWKEAGLPVDETPPPAPLN
jgi:hypothetical protein